MTCRRVLPLLPLLINLLSLGPAFSRDRTDVVYLKNGDRMTGEIRSVSQGLLQLQCDHGSGRYVVHWDRIERIESKKLIAVELSSGIRVRGPLTHQSDSRDVHVVTDENSGREENFRLPEVATMSAAKPGFWNHFDGSLDIGYSLTKSSSTQQLNSNATLLYNSSRYVANARLSSLYNSKKGTENTRRHQAGGYLRRLWRAKWFGFGGASFLHSDELELDRRTVLSGGMGRYLRRDSHHDFSIAGGVAWNNEKYARTDYPGGNSSEAVLLSQWNVYDLLDHDLNVINQIGIFKSFTRGNRVRVDLDMELRYSLPKDFYINFTFSDNYDSAPLGDTPKNDFVFSTGFGWSP